MLEGHRKGSFDDDIKKLDDIQASFDPTQQRRGPIQVKTEVNLFKSRRKSIFADDIKKLDDLLGSLDSTTVTVAVSEFNQVSVAIIGRWVRFMRERANQLIMRGLSQWKSFILRSSVSDVESMRVSFVAVLYPQCCNSNLCNL